MSCGELGLSARDARLIAELLPPPGETLVHLAHNFLSGSIYADLWATVYRTLWSFAIAVLIGVPLGIVLGSSESAYRSVEFVIDFFRSTPSSALIPLFLLIFGITDINKIAIASFLALSMSWETGIPDTVV